jgi:glycosyltransferase involved in cell wall biosynthesis
MELILIDDNGRGTGLQRELEKAVGRLEDAPVPVRYYANDRNRGAQASRNRGIRKSRGELIAFLDDDDLWDPDKIRLQAGLFRDPFVGLAYSRGWEATVREGRIRSVVPYNMSGCFLREVTFRDLSYGDYIGTTSQAVVRREAFRRCGMFDEKQPARQDYEMWIRISRKYRCVGAGEYLFTHVQHEGAQISKDPHKAVQGMLRIYRKYRRETGAAARWHQLFLIMKGFRAAKEPAGALNYGCLSGITLCLALLSDSRECARRAALHFRRTGRCRSGEKGVFPF